MESVKVDLDGSQGGKLAARLHRPPGIPRAYALFAHCFTCGKDLKSAVRISAALAERGIATMRFDFTGIGESEGDFADAGFSSNIQDLVAVARLMRERYAAPRILIGHSLGGAAVLAAAHEIDEVSAVATIGAPCDPAHVRKLIDSQAPDIDETGESEVTIAGRSFRISKHFLDDLGEQQQKRAIAELRRALLIFHSPQDTVVDVDNARRIYETARHPKSFVSLDGADHLLRKARDARYVAEVLASWSGRYLPEDTEAEAIEHGEVVVRGGPHGFANQVVAGTHELRADEPESVPGGADTGPSPYDYLLAGLGACTSMTLRMYADRKQWPLEGVRVRLRHGRIHAGDCEDCESKEGKIDEITRDITVYGDELDDEQRQRLVEIANKCPVHRTLTTETKIRTKLVED